MPRAQVISWLAGNFDVSGGSRQSICPEDAAGCILWEKGGQPPFSPVASLGFKNGVLDGVVKYWGPQNQQQAVPFARSVYALIASLEKDGRTICKLTAQQTESPGNEEKAAFITCGARSAEVSVWRNEKYGESADVSERLKQ